MKKSLIVIIVLLVVVVIFGIVVAFNFKYISNTANFKMEGCDNVEAFWVAKVLDKKGDINTCKNKIENEQCRNRCIALVAVNTKSLETCEEISKETAIDYYADCLTGIAWETKNVEICNKIPKGRISGKIAGPSGWPFRDMCIKNIKRKD